MLCFDYFSTNPLKNNIHIPWTLIWLESMNFPVKLIPFFRCNINYILVFFTGSDDHPNRWTNQRQPRYQGKETFSKIHFGRTDGQTGCLVVNPTESTTHYVQEKNISVTWKWWNLCCKKIMWNDMVVNWSIAISLSCCNLEVAIKSYSKNKQTSANVTHMWSTTMLQSTLRIIGPSKLAILRTLPLLYRFKPFHWRVQDH